MVKKNANNKPATTKMKADSQALKSIKRSLENLSRVDQDAPEAPPKPVARPQPEPQQEAAQEKSAPRTTSLQGLRMDAVRKRKRGSVEEDEFYVPPELIPEGYSIEWKRTHTLGQPEQAHYMFKLEENGWEKAPSHLFKAMLPKGYTGEFVERGGQILMMRPKHLTDEAAGEDLSAAREQVSEKMKGLGQTMPGELPRVVEKVNRSYERSSIPD